MARAEPSQIIGRTSLFQKRFAAFWTGGNNIIPARTATTATPRNHHFLPLSRANNQPNAATSNAIAAPRDSETSNAPHSNIT